jgi:hypothetical protein
MGKRDGRKSSPSTVNRTTGRNVPKIKDLLNCPEMAEKMLVN